MHEKATISVYTSKAQNTSRVRDPILRDYLRVSGSPMVTRSSFGPHGLRDTKKVRRFIKQGGLIPFMYIHRLLFVLTITSLTALVAAIWG